MSRKKTQFLCGVVEGFYGRPWTAEQRLDLFCHMSDWGMNSYLYAPKDDEKHRAYWREMYTLEEAADLSQLIKETTKGGIHFIYAISPGLDMTFSNKQEVALLKKKLDQVAALGCKDFAILFDDIDTDMLPADTKEFPSSAHAQVAIANDIYEHLGRPKIFLFCPTEYCASHAVPSVKESQYLKHIGTHLLPDVDVMWTGPKVISKVISESSIDELTAVIQRPPVIWDNLHANDYDQHRLFLGPYVGRSVELIPKLNGVLTNPNCEYGANYIPIHTLAQWSHCGRHLHLKSSPLSQSMLLEVEGRGGRGEVADGVEVMNDECDSGGNVRGVCLYEPQKALELSVREWFSEFKVPRRNPEHYRPEKNTAAAARANDYEDGGSSMDTSHPMLVSEVSNSSTRSENHTQLSSGPFSLDDVELLIDYFYLPHKHGSKAIRILEEFCWLKENAPGYELLKTNGCLKGSENADGSKGPSVEVGESRDGIRSDGETSESVVDDDMSSADVYGWCERAESFHQLCMQVNHMYTRLTTIPNRTLLYDVYQYVWNARETTMLLDSYIAWLEAGGSEVNPSHEPFSSKGGITAEMQSMLPRVKGSKKLIHRHKPPPQPSPKIFVIRPYRPEDKELLYSTCLETGDNGGDATDLFTNYPDLLGDRFVGPYLKLCRDLSFVLEDSQGVCGYVLAVLDSREFYSRFKREWLPIMLEKYPVPTTTATTTTTQSGPEESLLGEIRHLKFFLPDELQRDYPSHIHIDIMQRAQGQGVGVRMIKTILATLKAKDSRGVHLEMSTENIRALKFYRKLGFKPLQFKQDPLPAKNVTVLGRFL